MNDDHAAEGYVIATGLTEEILRQRADSLALEQSEQVEEQRHGILLFSLGEEWYGVRISQVRELYNEYVVTPVPCVPDYINGVVNIRGEIVSVTDLRAMMGLGRTESLSDGQQLPVIVVCDETVCTALVVDGLRLVDLESQARQPPPPSGATS